MWKRQVRRNHSDDVDIVVISGACGDAEAVDDEEL
jgi:hypothetical protein